MLPLKMEMFGNALATILAEGLPMITILTLYFMGKFSVKPKIGDLFKKFSPHTWPAMKVGVSQLFYQLSLAIPGIVLRKFLGLSAHGDPELYVNLTAAFNAQIRYYQIVFCVTAAVSMGFLPCASYAYGADRIKRFQDLLFHCTWIGSAWTMFTMIFTVGLPQCIVRAFSSEEEYVHWAAKLVRNSNILAFISPVALVIQALLQALQRGTRASIVTLGTQLLPLPVFSIILYYTNNYDPARLLYAYPIQQALGLMISIPLGFGPLREVMRRAKIEDTHQKIDDTTSEHGAPAMAAQHEDEGGVVEMTDL
jgi:Na+-driven multidrug efflux pump